MKIAVLSYATSEVDIIDTTDEEVEKYNDNVEEFLSQRCGYNPDEISFMCCDYIKVNSLTTKDFEQ